MSSSRSLPITGSAFQHAHPRYQTAYYESLVAKMLACGNPEQMGYLAYRCQHCGQGKHLVAMSCKSSLCLRVRQSLRRQLGQSGEQESSMRASSIGTSS